MKTDEKGRTPLISDKKKKLTIIRNDPAFQCRYPGCYTRVRGTRKYCRIHRKIIQSKGGIKKGNSMLCHTVIQIMDEINSLHEPKEIKLTLEQLKMIVKWTILQEEKTPYRVCLTCQKLTLSYYCKEDCSNGSTGDTKLESKAEFARRICPFGA